MATLITSTGTRAFDSTGESRLAERLEQKLHADYIPLLDQAFPKVAPLTKAHREGYGRGDMAVLCADWKTMDLRDSALTQRKVSYRVRKKIGEYQPGADAIQVMSIKVSKGLEFPAVAQLGVGHLHAAGVFYVAATRAMQRLVIAASGNAAFGKRLA